MRYYLAEHPDLSAALVALSRQTPYSTFDGAFSDMGTGVVFTPSGDIVAYHERHAYIIERKGIARMTAFAESDTYMH